MSRSQDPPSQDSSTPLVTTAFADGVFTVTLDAPARANALSTQLVSELHDAVRLGVQSRPRTLVLTHSGTVFCAGADLKEAAGRSGPPDATPLIEVMGWLMDAPFVTIAAARGPVRAGGVGLMASCDLVVVADDVSFAFTEVRIGVAPAIIAVPILARTSGSSMRAPLLTGSQFSAHDALDAGLVSHVVASEDVDVTVAQLCSSVRAGSPDAVAATKALARVVPTLSRDEAFAQMQALSAELFRGPDAAAGMEAFAQRRTPSWSDQSPASVPFAPTQTEPEPRTP